ncbi:MAG: hypothetical protein IPK98_19850 [Chloracidobacterium sp.]|nr:hypothetical protein [Chloracidobacterium sp.]
MREVFPGPTDLETVRSPGLRHRHYSPRAHVVLIGDVGGLPTTENSAFIGLHGPSADFRLAKICGDVEEYARVVFEFFRECDRREIETIYCETVEEIWIGAGLMDRRRRAAEGFERLQFDRKKRKVRGCFAELQILIGTAILNCFWRCSSGTRTKTGRICGLHFRYDLEASRVF